MVDRVSFTGGQYSVMTGLAVIHDANVIKRRRNKARSLMALNAVTIGWHMIDGFSCGGITIVTRSTVIYDSLVIKRGAGKGLSVVTHAAIFSCWNVGGIGFSLFPD
jgi:hypothetical protein